MLVRRTVGRISTMVASAMVLVVVAVVPSASAAPTYDADPELPNWTVHTQYDRGVAVGNGVVLDLKTCPVEISNDRGTTWRTGPADGCPDIGTVASQRYDPATGGAIGSASGGVLRVDASGRVVEWIPRDAGEIDADRSYVYKTYSGITLYRWRGGSWEVCPSIGPYGGSYHPLGSPATTYPDSGSRASEKTWTTPDGLVVVRFEHALAIHANGCSTKRMVELGACWPRMSIGVHHELVTCPADGGGQTHHVLDVTDASNRLAPAPWFIDPRLEPQSDRDPAPPRVYWRYDDPVRKLDDDLKQGGGVWLDSRGRWIIIDDFASPGWDVTWNIGSPATPTPRLTPAQRSFVTAVNATRRRMGLPPLIFDTSTATAAQWHADYVAENGASDGTGFHSQQAGKPQFTGSNPFLRCRRAGILDENCTEIGFPRSGRYSSEQAVATWLSSPWHGAPLLTHASAGFGRGPAGAVAVMQSDQRIWWDMFPPGTILDTDAPASTRTSFVRSYPGPGQRNVSLGWAGGESPDPLGNYRGDRERVGTIFHALTADRAVVTLRRARGGKLVPLLHAGRTRAHWSLRLGRGETSFFAATKLRAGERYVLMYRLDNGRRLRVPFTTMGATPRNPRRGCRALVRTSRFVRSGTRPARRMRVTPRSCPRRAWLRFRTIGDTSATNWRSSGRSLSMITHAPVEWQLRLGRRLVATGTVQPG